MYATVPKERRANLALLISCVAIALLGTLSCGGGSQSSGSTGAPKASNTLNFAPRVDLDTGGSFPNSLATGDFNGDGFQDIAVCNENSDTISVFLGDGNGKFSSPIITTIQSSALNGGAIAAGDINEDGRTDLFLATNGGTQARIPLLSKGDGTFTQLPEIPSATFLRARLVDLNGDKHLDVVAAANGNMTVALGNGDGTFSALTYLDNGTFPGTFYGMDVGDVNGDGKLDIIGVNLGSNIGDIVIFLGNGDGTFQSSISQSAIASAPDSVSAADFNHDGKLDLLVGYNSGDPTLFTGNGDGTFVMSGLAPGGSAQGTGSTVLAVDMNGDGKPDTLVTDYSSGVFSIALGTASGVSNSAQYTSTVAPGLSDIAVADFNRDGKPDVALTNNQTNRVSVILSE
jgi:FG-GAP-like repeat